MHACRKDTKDYDEAIAAFTKAFNADFHEAK
jgi:hypothetical protein